MLREKRGRPEDGDGGGLTARLVAGAMRGRGGRFFYRDGWSRWRAGVAGNGGTRRGRKCALLEESLSNAVQLTDGEGRYLAERRARRG